MSIQKITLSAMMIALGIVLPFLTLSNPSLGQMFLLMHIPVLLAGLLLGKYEGFLVGFLTPLLRSLIVGIPLLFPTATIMAMELATYGFIAGLIVGWLSKSSWKVEAALVISMIVGRMVYGLASSIIYGITQSPYGIDAFLAGAFINAWPGIILQLVLIPVITRFVFKQWHTQKKV